MNRAEFITFTVDRLNQQDAISPRESVSVLLDLVSILNSGKSQSEIDESEEMKRLWEEVNKKWGKL